MHPGLLMVYCVYLALEVAGRAYLVAHPGRYQHDTTGTLQRAAACYMHDACPGVLHVWDIVRVDATTGCL